MTARGHLMLADATVEPSSVAASPAVAAEVHCAKNARGPHHATEFLRALLASGPVPAGTIKAAADDAGHAWRTVQRAAGLIGAERRKDGLRGGWIWALSPEPKAPRQPESASPQTEATSPDQAPAAPRSAVPSIDEADYASHRWGCLACLAADRLPQFERCAVGQRLRGAFDATPDARGTKGRP